MVRLIVLTLLATRIATPQSAATFSIDAVMSAPFASELIASPKGARAAWVLNEAGVRNIWVAEGATGRARRLTSFTKDDGQDLGELAWTADGESLLFVRGGDFENGGENPNPDLSSTTPDQSIWSVSFADGKMRKLTEGQAPAVSPSGDSIAFIRSSQIFLMGPDGNNIVAAVTSKTNPSSLEWSPSGKQLAFVSSRRDHSFIGLYTPANKTLDFIDPSTARDSHFSWNPDGSELAFVRVPAQVPGYGPQRTGEPWSVRVFDLRTHSGKEVFRAAPGVGSVFHPVTSEQQIFWGSHSRLIFPWEKTGWLHLFCVSPDGTGEAAELTPGDGIVEHVRQSKDGKRLWYSSNIDDIDRRHIWQVDPDPADKPKQVTHGDGIEWLPTPLADGSGMMVLASTYNRKSHAASVSEDGRLTPLAPESVPASFPASALVKPEPVIVTAADGMALHAQLFRPASNNEKQHPALVFFHGGSRRQMLLGFHYMYYYSNAYALNQFFAQQGYVVLSVNYRSGIGYGMKFREALNYGPSGGSEYADVIGAALYLKSRSDVDPKRIGVWGGSYGGYLTAMALARGSDLFAAGVDFHGVHDWSTTRTFEYSGGDPDEVQRVQAAARVAFESSPMASVAQWHSPVLLIQGDDDRNVPFAQTVLLAAALRRRHVEFEELIFPNEIHDFLEHKHWVEAYKASANFFQRHLGN